METILYPIEKRKVWPQLERFEPLLQDHTAMNLLDQCDWKYFLRIVLGFTPTESKYQNLLDAGSAYHKFREVLERSFIRCASCKHPPHIGICNSKDCSCSSYAPEQNLDVCYGEAMKPVMKCDIAPARDPKYEYMDKGALITCCDFAYEHWVLEKKKGVIRVVAIEQPFNLQLPDGSYTAGRADQIIDWNGDWGRDFKFTGKWTEFFKRTLDPREQGTRYTYSESELLGRRVEGVVFEGLHHSFTKSGGLKISIESHFVSKTDSQLRRWLDDKIHINRQLEINRQYDHWPMRTSNCEYCDFARVCRKPNDRSMLAELETYFVRKPWDHEKVDQEEI